MVYVWNRSWFSWCVWRDSQFNNSRERVNLTIVRKFLWQQWKKNHSNKSLAQTSCFNLPNAYVDHHGSLRVVCLHECCEVTTIHLLDPLEIRLAVIGNMLGTLFVYVQSTVCKQRSHIRLAQPLRQSPVQIIRYQKQTWKHPSVCCISLELASHLEVVLSTRWAWTLSPLMKLLHRSIFSVKLSLLLAHKNRTSHETVLITRQVACMFLFFGNQKLCVRMWAFGFGFPGSQRTPTTFAGLLPWSPWCSFRGRQDPVCTNPWPLHLPPLSWRAAQSFHSLPPCGQFG